jgi:nicotinamide riboside kinase
VSRSPRIALLGGESTGKTTLATALAATVRGIVVTEALRDFVADRGRPPERDEQRSILIAQRLREDHAATEHPHAPLLCDPATLMTAVYSQLYFDDDSLADDARAFARDYDALLWCRPDIPWTPDPGQHDGPEFRSRADALVGAWVRELAPSLCVIEITGTVGRLAIAQHALTARLGSAWEPEGTGLPT